MLDWDGRIIRRCAPHPAGRRRYATTFSRTNALESNLKVLILPHLASVFIASR